MNDTIILWRKMTQKLLEDAGYYLPPAADVEI